MAKIFVENVTAEMILEQPVKDQHGLVIFQKGTVVTDTIIKTLKTRGVIEISIEGEGVLGSSSIDPLIIEFATAETQELFRNNTQRGPFVTELIRHIAHRLALRSSEGRSHEN